MTRAAASARSGNAAARSHLSKAHPLDPVGELAHQVDRRASRA